MVLLLKKDIFFILQTMYIMYVQQCNNSCMEMELEPHQPPPFEHLNPWALQLPIFFLFLCFTNSNLSSQKQSTTSRYFNYSLPSTQYLHSLVGTWYMEHGTWNMEYGTWNMEHGTSTMNDDDISHSFLSSVHHT